MPYWFVDAGALMMLVLAAAIDEGLASAFIGHPDQKRIFDELLGLPEPRSCRSASRSSASRRPTRSPNGALSDEGAAASGCRRDPLAALVERGPSLFDIQFHRFVISWKTCPCQTAPAIVNAPAANTLAPLAVR